MTDANTTDTPHDFVLSLDEIDYVKRKNGFDTINDFANATGLHPRTWSRALNTRKPTARILVCLANLGARPHRLLTTMDTPTMTTGDG